jgi:hypothetical protein
MMTAIVSLMKTMSHRPPAVVSVSVPPAATQPVVVVLKAIIVLREILQSRVQKYPVLMVWITTVMACRMLMIRTARFVCRMKRRKQAASMAMITTVTSRSTVPIPRTVKAPSALRPPVV